MKIRTLVTFRAMTQVRRIHMNSKLAVDIFLPLSGCQPCHEALLSRSDNLGANQLAFASNPWQEQHDPEKNVSVTFFSSCFVDCSSQSFVFLSCECVYSCFSTLDYLIVLNKCNTKRRLSIVAFNDS